MYLLYLFISFLIYRVHGGELLIATNPNSIKFEGDEAIDQHLIPELFSAAMGFSTQQEADWSGMIITNPFKFSKAVVVLFVDGVPSLGKNSNFKKFIVNNDEDELTTWRRIKNKILDRFPLENNTMVKVELSQDEDYGNFGNQNIDEDMKFLNEVNELEKYMSTVESKPKSMVPDLYWFSLRSLHPLSDVRGSEDAATFRAKEKVQESLSKLAKVFGSAYHERALVVALVSDVSHTRRERSVGEEKAEPVPKSESYKDLIYDEDFPVMFNIILWFSLGLFFSLLAVSVFIASMDPGRDSIIYRMTSNRMKKDS